MAYMNVLKFHSVQLPPMNCRIALNPPEKGCYTCGDLINGEVSLSCLKDIYSFGIKVALEGRAVVKFKDQGHQTKNSLLLETTTYVHGKGESRIRLQPGDNLFPFSLELPSSASSTSLSLPGSFRSPLGLIIYQIVVYVHLEFKLVRKAEKTVAVLGYLNLSTEPSLLQTPIVFEKVEKTLLPSLISRRVTSHFKFTYRMPHSGFLPGEEIPFELEVDNPSSYDIRVLVISLIQKITYNAGTAWKVKQRIFAKKEKTQMDSPNGTLWGDCIEVPGGCVPNQKGIIEIAYLVKIEVKVTGSGSCLKGEVPITIGTTKDDLFDYYPPPDRRRSSGLQDTGKRDELHPRQLQHAEGEKISRVRSPSPSQMRMSSRRCNHQSLDRSESVRCSAESTVPPHPPRYSMLSMRPSRASSVETLPPTYEDALKDDKSPDVESIEIIEFQNLAEEELQLEEEEDYEPIEDDNDNGDKPTEETQVSGEGESDPSLPHLSSEEIKSED